MDKNLLLPNIYYFWSNPINNKHSIDIFWEVQGKPRWGIIVHKLTQLHISQRKCPRNSWKPQYTTHNRIGIIELVRFETIIHRQTQISLESILGRNKYGKSKILRQHVNHHFPKLTQVEILKGNFSGSDCWVKPHLPIFSWGLWELENSHRHNKKAANTHQHAYNSNWMLQDLTLPHFDKTQRPNRWIIAILKIKISAFHLGTINKTQNLSCKKWWRDSIWRNETSGSTITIK